MPTKTRINGENYTQLPRLVSDDIILKGLPNTPGAPAGYGDLASAVNTLQNRTNAAPYAAQLLNGNGGNFAGNITLAQMVMIPHEFVAIRIGYAFKGGAGNLTGAKFLVATTDNIGDLSQTQTVNGRQYVVPMKNGVTYNDLSADGWQVVNFSGSPTLSIADPGLNNFAVVFSDVIKIKSIPVTGALSGRFSGSFPLLVRAFAGTGQFTRGGLTGFGSTTGFIAQSGSLLQMGCAKAGDAVATLGDLTASSTVDLGDANSIPVIVQAYTNNGSAVSILTAGDSRFASSSEFPSQLYRNLQFFIEQKAQSSALDYKCVSVSEGSRTTDVFNQRAIAYMGAGGFANCSLYLSYSINDGFPSEAVLDNCKYRLILFVEKCREKGIVPLVMTAFPFGTGYGDASSARLTAYVSWVKSLGVPVIDPLEIYGVLPHYTWKPGFNFDDAHMTDAGYQDLAERCIDFIANNV